MIKSSSCRQAVQGKIGLGGLKPHFCSISFGNPISPLTNRLCSLPAPGMWHYLSTESSSTLAASLLPHHPAEGFLPSLGCAAETAGSQLRCTQSCSMQSCSHTLLHPQGTAFPLLLYGLEVEVLPLSRTEVIFPLSGICAFCEGGQGEEPEQGLLM